MTMATQSKRRSNKTPTVKKVDQWVTLNDRVTELELSSMTAGSAMNDTWNELFMTQKKVKELDKYLIYTMCAVIVIMWVITFRYTLRRFYE